MDPCTGRQPNKHTTSSHTLTPLLTQDPQLSQQYLSEDTWHSKCCAASRECSKRVTSSRDMGSVHCPLKSGG